MALSNSESMDTLLYLEFIKSIKPIWPSLTRREYPADFSQRKFLLNTILRDCMKKYNPKEEIINETIYIKTL